MRHELILHLVFLAFILVKIPKHLTDFLCFLWYCSLPFFNCHSNVCARDMHAVWGAVTSEPRPIVLNSVLGQYHEPGRSRILWEKLIFPQLLKKFCTCCGTRRFLTTCTETHRLSLTLSQVHPIHALQPCFFKIRLNIILPSTLRFSKWFLFP